MHNTILNTTEIVFTLFLWSFLLVMIVSVWYSYTKYMYQKQVRKYKIMKKYKGE